VAPGFLLPGSSPALSAARTAVGRLHLHLLAPLHRLHCTACRDGRRAAMHACGMPYPTATATGPVRVGVVDPSSARPPCPLRVAPFQNSQQYVPAATVGTCARVRRAHVSGARPPCSRRSDSRSSQRWSPARSRRAEVVLVRPAPRPRRVEAERGRERERARCLIRSPTRPAQRARVAGCCLRLAAWTTDVTGAGAGVVVAGRATPRVLHTRTGPCLPHSGLALPRLGLARQLS
jgi:hypothetical protein